jgi:hypothetical protein
VKRVIIARQSQVASVQFSIFYGFLNALEIGPNRLNHGDWDKSHEYDPSGHFSSPYFSPCLIAGMER